MRKYNFEKTVNLLHYLAKLAGGNINKMKALKLLWLSDRLHLRLYGRTIIDDEYFAMDNGPVASTARDILESNSWMGTAKLNYASALIKPTNSKHIYECCGDFNSKYFSKTDIATINSVFDEFKTLSEFQLSELSHVYPEWKEYEDQLSKGVRRVKMDKALFFENANDKRDSFNQDEETLEYTKSVYY